MLKLLKVFLATKPFFACGARVTTGYGHPPPLDRRRRQASTQRPTKYLHSEAICGKRLSGHGDGGEQSTTTTTTTKTTTTKTTTTATSDEEGARPPPSAPKSHAMTGTVVLRVSAALTYLREQRTGVATKMGPIGPASVRDGNRVLAADRRRVRPSSNRASNTNSGRSPFVYSRVHRHREEDAEKLCKEREREKAVKRSVGRPEENRRRSRRWGSDNEE